MLVDCYTEQIKGEYFPKSLDEIPREGPVTFFQEVLGEVVAQHEPTDVEEHVDGVGKRGCNGSGDRLPNVLNAVYITNCARVHRQDSQLFVV